MKKLTGKQIFTFLIITLSYGIMFRVSYMKNVFYDPMISAFGITNTQLATMTAFYSTTKIFIYVPCGLISDRLGARKSLTFATTLLTVLTFGYAFAHEFWMLCLINAGLAVANCMQLGAALKIIRSIGSTDGQGRARGMSELMRGVASLLVNFVALGLFSAVEHTSDTPLRPVLIFYGCVYAVFAIFTFIVCPKKVSDDEVPPTLRDYLDTLKHPVVWLLAMLTMTAYAFEVCIDYTTPYLTNIMGMSTVIAGVLATIRSFGLSLFCGPVFGFINDKYKSYSRTLLFIFVLQAAVGIAFICTPCDPAFVALGIALTMLAAVGIYGFTSTQWTLLEEVKIPQKVSATAVGIICMIGYTPDIFVSLLIGNRLDNSPGEEAYKFVFMYAVIFALLALIVTFLVRRIVKKRQRAEAAAIQNENPLTDN